MMNGKNSPNTPSATEMAKEALALCEKGYLTFHPVHLEELFKEAGYSPTDITRFHDRARSNRWDVV